MLLVILTEKTGKSSFEYYQLPLILGKLMVSTTLFARILLKGNGVRKELTIFVYRIKLGGTIMSN